MGSKIRGSESKQQSIVMYSKSFASFTGKDFCRSLSTERGGDDQKPEKLPPRNLKIFFIGESSRQQDVAQISKQAAPATEQN